MEKLGGSQPTPAAMLLLSQGSRTLGGLESPGMSTPTLKRLLSMLVRGGTPRRTQSLPIGINLMRQGKNHCLCFMQREMMHRGTGGISPLLWQSLESIGISCSPDTLYLLHILQHQCCSTIRDQLRAPLQHWQSRT